MEFLKEFKIIWNYLKEYKKEVYKISIFALIGSIIIALIPFLYGKIVDIVQNQPNELMLILAILILWLFMSLLGAIFHRVVDQKGSFLATDLHADLICKSSMHIIQLPLSFHKEKKIGEVYTKMERGASYLSRIVETILFWTLPQFLTAIIGILILFLIYWQLAIGVLVVFLGYILITIYKTSPIIKAQEKVNEIFEEVSGNLYDAILNTQTIKACSAENFQKERVKKDYKEKAANADKYLTQLWINLSFWQSIFLAFGFVIVFGMAIFLLRANLISVGGLIMFFGYLNLARTPLEGLGWKWQLFRTGMTAIKRTEGLLKIMPEDYKEEGKILKEMQGKVEFKNVNFEYKKGGLVLENINFIVQPGEIIALVGGSGEGKTTLVDLISLYLKPSQGKILIDDIDIEDFNLQSLREKIAYVFQEIMLFNDSIKNNIRFGNLKASEEDIINAAKAANAHYFIENFPDKYNQIAGERGVKLSTGQKQRIAIARALVRNSKILILDEATSSLDSESERLVQEALERLIKNRTTFVIAHRLSTVKKANRILVLEKGKITEQGTHQELIKNKRTYFKFYSLQQGKLK